MIKKELEVHSVFTSISGEVGYFRQGQIVKFLRLQGCNMRCPWCDTEQSQIAGDDPVSIDQVADQIGASRNILITGGEPLLQQSALISLIRGFRSDCFTWQIETNGTIMPLPALRMMENVYWVVDRKFKSALGGPLPGHRAITTGFKLVDDFPLTENDWLKYIIFNMDELDEALAEIAALYMRGPPFWSSLPHMAISPIWSADRKGVELTPSTVFHRILHLQKHGPLAVVNIQLHKLVDME